MSDIDPVLGPVNTDRSVFVAIPGERPYEKRILYVQVDHDAEGAVQLPDDDRWWIPQNPVTPEESQHLIDGDEYMAALQASLDARTRLLGDTRARLIELGLSVEQADLLLEGK